MKKKTNSHYYIWGQTETIAKCVCNDVLLYNGSFYLLFKVKTKINTSPKVLSDFRLK